MRWDYANTRQDSRQSSRVDFCETVVFGFVVFDRPARLLASRRSRSASSFVALLPRRPDRLDFQAFKAESESTTRRHEQKTRLEPIRGIYVLVRDPSTKLPYVA